MDAVVEQCLGRRHAGCRMGHVVRQNLVGVGAAGLEARRGDDPVGEVDGIGGGGYVGRRVVLRWSWHEVTGR